MTTGPRASPARSIRRVMAPGYPTHDVIRAVLFDWGNTLVALGVRSGAARRGPRARASPRFGAGAPGAGPAFTDAYSRAAAAAARRRSGRTRSTTRAEVASAARIARRRRAMPTAVSRFVVAEQPGLAPGASPRAGRRSSCSTRCARDGLKVGLISNAFDPPALMRELCSPRSGCSSASMRSPLSAEVGKRKPHPPIFESRARAGSESSRGRR